jgi:hypothetical protein
MMNPLEKRIPGKGEKKAPGRADHKRMFVFFLSITSTRK